MSISAPGRSLGASIAPHYGGERLCHRIGDPYVLASLNESIASYGCSISFECDPLVATSGKRTFGRDSRVIGMNHMHHLPYCLNTVNLDYDFFAAHLPASFNHFLSIHEKHSGYGNGFIPEQVAAAAAYAKAYGIPYAQMRSVIEGGNSYVFFDYTGQAKAIIGIASVILTALGLQEQGYFRVFQNALIERAKLIADPSSDSIRAMRNFSTAKAYKRWQLSWAERFGRSTQQGKAAKSLQAIMEYMRGYREELDIHQKECAEWEGENSARARFIAPVTEKDKELYSERARIWQAMCSMAKEVIAEDLGIASGRIAFVPHRTMHIDMELFVEPGGKNVYIDKGSFETSLVDILRQIGCNSIALPGIIHIEGKGDQDRTLNFMNGCFIATSKGTLFVTNDVEMPEDEVWLKTFRTAFLRHCPNIEIAFCPGSQKIFRKHGGGLHCLTWTARTYSTPVECILSYLADESMPDEKRRRWLYQATRLFTLVDWIRYRYL
jgi:hypothetical protein